MLLDEINQGNWVIKLQFSDGVVGGVVDRSHQVLTLLLMTLGPEDINKVKIIILISCYLCQVLFGRELTAQAIGVLQLLRDTFGILMKIRDAENGIIISCLGIGFANMSRKIR